MTVLPFAPDRDDRPSSVPESLAGSPPNSLAGRTVRVTGTFHAPSGTVGTFTGNYRLERLRSEFGQLAAAGVVAGQLVDLDGTMVAMGSRRHTAAAELCSDAGHHRVQIGPVDVNIAGLMVSVNEFVVVLQREPSGPR